MKIKLQLRQNIDMYTWDPELPEWLVLLYGIIVVVDVLRVVHHVQQKLVLRAAVVDVLIVLDGKPLTRNIRKMNFLPIKFKNLVHFRFFSDFPFPLNILALVKRLSAVTSS